MQIPCSACKIDAIFIVIWYIQSFIMLTYHPSYIYIFWSKCESSLPVQNSLTWGKTVGPSHNIPPNVQLSSTNSKVTRFAWGIIHVWSTKRLYFSWEHCSWTLQKWHWSKQSVCPTRRQTAVLMTVSFRAKFASQILRELKSTGQLA